MDEPRAGLTRERDSLVATKLRVPGIRSDLLARPRLVRRLEEATHGELVLVSAPPGFGKSTLLADWARSTGRPVAWVSLDADDNDFPRFWRYVTAAVGRVRPEVEAMLAPLLRSDQPAPEAVVGTLVNELGTNGRELVLVLDDYHVIESPAIHSSLAFLLERAPPGLRLLIAGRTDPPLPLALLRARGMLVELRAPDLRFTPEEASTLLLEAWRLDLSAESAAALAERTEGWVSGLQLAALSLRDAADGGRLIAGFTGSHRYVLDYLTAEVLERQPEDVRSFLLETSILERLCGSLCDAVTSLPNGQRMLERLERANLFLVALDEERRWYRYHRLFADLLRARLEECCRERLPELHGRAAAWCDAHGLVDDAVRHALAAGDSRGAGDLVERHVDEVLRRGEGATLRRWLSALTPEVVRAKPGLALVQAITAFNAGRLETAEAFLEDAEGAGGDRLPRAIASPDSALAMIPATIATVRASLAIARGRPERARDLANQALTLLTETDSGARISVRWNIALADWMDGHPADAERELARIVAEGRAGGTSHLALTAGAVLGRVRRAQGRLAAALRVNEEGLERATTAAGHPVVLAAGEAHIGMAEVLYERDLVDDAMRHVDEGIELCRRLTSTQALSTGLATLAWIRQARGDFSGASDAMEDAYRVLPSHDVVSLFNPVPAERARLLLAQGRLPEAADWVEERGLAGSDHPAYAREREYLVLARVLVARGAPESALAVLGRLAAAARAEGRMGSLIEMLVQDALALAAMGDRAHALERLIEALALGRPEGYVRVFADEGPPMAALVGALIAGGRRRGPSAATHIPTDYLGRVLRALRRDESGAEPARLPTAARLVEGLTRRELEVLELIATGRSNREIADEFVVTLDTVKKHVTHVLDKLGAANRTQAVAQARELGLIP